LRSSNSLEALEIVRRLMVDLLVISRALNGVTREARALQPDSRCLDDDRCGSMRSRTPSSRLLHHESDVDRALAAENAAVAAAWHRRCARFVVQLTATERR
jgi:hypothetical protein